MMSKTLTLSVVATIALICGCATNDPTVTSGVSKISVKEVADRPVELPGGYDVDDFRRLRMMIADGQFQSNSSALTKQRDFMNLRFQSEMDKQKRFEFNAVHGLSAANKALAQMKDTGLVDTSDSEDEDEGEGAIYGKAPSYLLGWTINIQEQKEAMGSCAQKFKWLCSVNATVSCVKDIKRKDGSVRKHKGDILLTRDFDRPIISRKQELNKMGGVKSGFSYKSDADVQALMQEIVIAATERIAYDLNCMFPVGGEISSALDMDTIVINQGVDQGVEAGMPMVVFARFRGVDVPLANATATPTVDSSTLEVWRKAESKHAKKILDEINDDPMGWMKMSGNKLYAVRAIPKRDQAKGTRFEKK